MRTVAACGTVASDPAAWHLLARVELLGTQVADAVARRRDHDASGADGFHGSYLSDAYVDALLTGRVPRSFDAGRPEALVTDVEDEATRMEDAGLDLPLKRLARCCALDETDVAILLVALAPEIEPTFQPLYAYLQDDESRSFPSPALALELACGPAGPLAERRRLGPRGPLVARHLVRVQKATHPFSARSLVVPDRVVGHLLGDGTQDPLVTSTTREVAHVSPDEGQELVRAISAGASFVYARDTDGSAAAAAAAACRRIGRAPLVVDLTRLDDDDDDESFVAALAREVSLSQGTLIAGPIEALERRSRLLRLLTGEDIPIVLFGSRRWDVRWSTHPPAVVDAPVATRAERAALWKATVGPALGAGAATRHFRLGPDEIVRAGRAAALRGALRGGEPTVEDVHVAARLQGSSGLERLALRVEPRAGWGDLVVPPAVDEALHELAARARFREQVLVEWGMGGTSSRGRGMAALFAGPSGTGKTMGAEVIARDLGADLYVVDLSSVVDKYVGETEKNLERIFDEAERVNGVLLFDEADALFGKRSGVEDARDRYANIETAYLLQRIESFGGVAILTSNLRGNLDEAFTRRLDAVIELPMPDEPARRRIWDANLPPGVPREEDVDVSFLARFELSGGHIRNACLSAAFRAAALDRRVSMTDLVRGVAQEYSKLGHMCVAAEFGPYHDLVRS